MATTRKQNKTRRRTASKKKPTKQPRLWGRFILKLGFTLLVLGGFSLAYLDAWVAERFDGRKWHIPATVYARPLTLYQGQVISQARIIEELRAAGYQAGDPSRRGNYRVQGGWLEIHLRPFVFWDGAEPAQRIRVRIRGGRVSDLKGVADGGSLVRLEPVNIGAIHTRLHEARRLVRIDDVPDSLVNALLVTEDRHFYDHHGVSPRAIFRAMRRNISAGRIVQGGSTITQQLVKNFFLTNERSFTRKGLEAVIAILLEVRTEKSEILEAYINEVFVAQDGDRAIHGFGLASEYFFSRSIDELQPHQSALMVAIMKGPSYYHPIKHPERALKRRNLVLDMMAEQGLMSEAEASRYQNMPLGVEANVRTRQNYSAYLDLVRQQLRRDYSEKDLASQGLRIFTHMNPQWQWRAQDKLTSGIERLEKRYGGKASGVEGAVIVVDHASGDVVALAGGTATYSGAYNRALYAKRPIGSLVKPAVYLTALEKGYQLQTPISDAPMRVTVNGKAWQPENFDRRSHTMADLPGIEKPKSGDDYQVPLYYALAKSYNIAAVRLGMDLGINSVSDTLRRLGFDGHIPQVPSLMLGAVEMAPTDVAQIYMTLANGGFYAPLKSILQVTDHDGQTLTRYPLQFEQRVALEPVHMLDYGLQSVMHEGTGRSVAKRFAANHRIAGKTGTSNDQRDSWFAGYDTSKTAVVWLGFDDNRPLPFTAAGGALQIWASLMQEQHGVAGPSPVPDNIVYHWVDPSTGELSREGCKGAVYLPYRKGSEPQQEGPCYKNNSILHWFKKWFQ